MKNRIEWIDISKFIAITIMILGHLGMPTSLSNLVHIFHMPVFFLLSGVCYKPEKYNKFLDFVLNRAKGLLVPYFVWGGGNVLYMVYSPQISGNGKLFIPFGFFGRVIDL